MSTSAVPVFLWHSLVPFLTNIDSSYLKTEDLDARRDDDNDDDERDDDDDDDEGGGSRRSHDSRSRNGTSKGKFLRLYSYSCSYSYSLIFLNRNIN